MYPLSAIPFDNYWVPLLLSRKIRARWFCLWLYLPYSHGHHKGSSPLPSPLYKQRHDIRSSKLFQPPYKMINWLCSLYVSSSIVPRAETHCPSGEVRERRD